MIALQMGIGEFAQDLYELIRAFYPGEAVEILCSGEETPGAEDGKCMGACAQDLHGTAQKKGRAAVQDAVAQETEGFRYRLDVSRLAGQELELELLWLAGQGGELARGRVVFPPEAGKTQRKNLLKSAVYELLCGYTGRQLPWGSLTGIRPVKIPMALLEKGMTDAQIFAEMQRTYHTGEKKTALAISIAHRERALLQKMDYANGYSIYVGIPFCPSICLYCSFSSSPLSAWKDQVDAYLDALCREMDACARLWPDKRPQTVYIGGGTPTTLAPSQLDRLLTELGRLYDLGGVLEFTVEAGRPDTITEETLRVLKAHPVTRISINPQTMNDRTLAAIGRGHTSAQTVEAYHLARRLGFGNINMDLIIGLPGEGYGEVAQTMQEVASLAPDSITVHSLALKRAARLNLFRSDYQDISFVNSQEILDMTASYAAALGQFPYYLYRQKNMAGNFENVGYARPGAEGLYNILIMEEKQSILAMGAGGATKIVQGDKIRRIENVKDIRSYLMRVDEMIARKTGGNE